MTLECRLVFHFGVFCVSLMLIVSAHAGEKTTNYGVFGPSSFSPQGETVLIRWDTEEGQTRLARSSYKNDFFQLADNFQPQANPLYCGIASSVIVLNAMRLNRNEVPSQRSLEVVVPSAMGGGRLQYREYSQMTLLDERTEPVKARVVIELKNAGDGAGKIQPGLTLAQLKGILEAYHVRVVLHYVDTDSEDAIRGFRKDLKAVLTDSERFLVVNFKGKALGTSTDGHISPVAAYDEQSDSVLVLDVAGHRNPWYWAPAADLYGAMHTLDGEHYRGYLVIEDAPALH
ncbi:MAG: phytochelatin synthase family protein [Anaerolineales bacterium]